MNYWLMTENIRVFLLCQTIDESVDGNNRFTPDKRNIVFNKQGEIVLLCNDAEWYRIMKSYGSVENYLKTLQTELEF